MDVLELRFLSAESLLFLNNLPKFMRVFFLTGLGGLPETIPYLPVGISVTVVLIAAALRADLSAI